MRTHNPREMRSGKLTDEKSYIYGGHINEVPVGLVKNRLRVVPTPAKRLPQKIREGTGIARQLQSCMCIDSDHDKTCP